MSITARPSHRARSARAALLAVVSAALIALPACAPAAPGGGAGQAPTTTAGPASPPADADAATRDDSEFNRLFTHRFADVDGVRMHYVTGGRGAPLVLLHGWPQSWFMWRDIMPALAERFTVYAVDLPGLGDSEGAPPAYDKATLARYVHTLISTRLGLPAAHVAGHDLGAAVAFQYAAHFPRDTRGLAYLDLPLPGPAIDARTYRGLSWHIAFHSQPQVPETVVDDDVREYLALFYPQVAFGGVAFGGPGARSPFDDRDVTEYARTYARPQVLHGGFELYRALDRDVADNTATPPVATPTLLLTAQGLLESTRATVAPRLTDLRALEVPGAGHWVVEENPAFVTKALVDFLGG